MQSKPSPGITDLRAAVRQSASTTNNKFTDSTGKVVDYGVKAAKLDSANALMLSYAMDMLVKHGVVTADERDNAMRDLYREVGVL